jgi:hypothetical protein
MELRHIYDNCRLHRDTLVRGAILWRM